jgi:adenine-specific DNA-methyltransferase
MTAVLDYYELAYPHPSPLPLGEGGRNDELAQPKLNPLPLGEGGRRPGEGIQGAWNGFEYKTVPHVTLKSIANNPEIDGIHARWAEKIYEFLVSSFEFLDQERVRWHLEKAEFCLLEQYINEGSKDDPQLETKKQKRKTLLAERRAAIDAGVARHAPQETCYDPLLMDRKEVRVTDPFTVEVVPAPAVKSRDDLLFSSSGRGGGGEGIGKKPKQALDPELLEFARQLRRVPTDTECLLWLLLSDRRFMHCQFRRQHPTLGLVWSISLARRPGWGFTGRRRTQRTRCLSAG